jgi:hypothetical protein
MAATKDSDAACGWEEIVRGACDTLGIPYDDRAKAWADEARRDLLDYLEAPIEGPEHDAALAKFRRTRIGQSFRSEEAR